MSKRWIRPYWSARPKRKYLLSASLASQAFPDALLRGKRRPRKLWSSWFRIKKTRRFSTALLQAPAVPFPDALLQPRKRRRLKVVFTKSERTAVFPIPAAAVVDGPILLRTITTYARPPPRKKRRPSVAVLFPIVAAPPFPDALLKKRPYKPRRRWHQVKTSQAFYNDGLFPPPPDAIVTRTTKVFVRRYVPPRWRGRLLKASLIPPPTPPPPFPDALLRARPKPAWRKRRKPFKVRVYYLPILGFPEELLRKPRKPKRGPRKTRWVKPRRLSVALIPPPIIFPVALLKRRPKRPKARAIIRRRRRVSVVLFLPPPFPTSLLQARRKIRRLPKVSRRRRRTSVTVFPSSGGTPTYTLITFDALFVRDAPFDALFVRDVTVGLDFVRDVPFNADF